MQEEVAATSWAGKEKVEDACILCVHIAIVIGYGSGNNLTQREPTSKQRIVSHPGKVDGRLISLEKLSGFSLPQRANIKQ